MKKENLKRLVLTAVMLGLATALSVIPIFPEPPMGGKITLASMLPVILIVLKYDFKWGVLTTVTYSVIQLLLSLGEVLSWSLSGEIFLGVVFLDYILPYAFLFTAGAFKKYGNPGVLVGAGLALVIRFVFHFISGMVLWDYVTDMGFWGAVSYSTLYNGGYMLPELVITELILAALIATKAYKKIMKA